MKKLIDTNIYEKYEEKNGLVFTDLKGRSGLAQSQLKEIFGELITNSGTISSSDFMQATGVPLDGKEVVGDQEFADRWNCSIRTAKRHNKKNDWIVTGVVEVIDKKFTLGISQVYSVDNYAPNIGRYAFSKRK